MEFVIFGRIGTHAVIDRPAVSIFVPFRHGIFLYNG